MAFKSFPNFDEYDSGYTDVQGEFWIESEFFGGCEEVSVIYAGDSIVINIDDKDTIIPFHEGMVNEIDLNENYITIPVFYQ